MNNLKKHEFKYPNIIFPSNEPIEWWYFTGHLENYGFEFCIFKLSPKLLKFWPLTKIKKPFIILHASITDKKTKKFQSFQEMTRKYDLNKGLEISTKNFSLKLEDKFFLKYKDQINLQITPQKRLVKYHENAYCRYKSNPNHETYYVSFTRNKIEGRIKANKVKGIGWFDHQKSNIPKKPQITGWDWFGIMLEDKEIMIYSLRGRSEETKAYVIDKSSKTKEYDDVTIKQLNTWKSPKTNIVYPSGWKISFSSYEFFLFPHIKDQEMITLKTSPTTYWEGSCYVAKKSNGEQIIGNAYAELVGYDNRFFSRFIRKIMTK